MGRKRASVPNKNKLRNLVQYRDLSDAEFDDVFDALYGDDQEDFDIIEELESRIKSKIEALGEDYDLLDMKANDMIQLRALVLASLQLDDIEQELYKRRQSISESNILVLEKLNKMASTLRSDISTLSEDLQLTKKIRSRSKEASVIKRWDDLVEKAYEFYRDKMLYVFCPHCKMLLATTWLLYTENKTNEISLNCERCNNSVAVKLHSLYETDNKNLDDVVIP